MRLDRLDQQIISALEDDGRRPYRDIARDLGVAEATVRARVGRLTDAGLIRITAVGDPLSLGIEVGAISLISVKPGSSEKTAQRLAAYPNVRFVGESFGSADIIIQTLHPDLRSLHRFIGTELPAALPEITRTETFQLARVVKSTWNWRAWFEQTRDEPEDKPALLE
jgi:Lrp/AsnC family transcriptional regulator for asnA, asnC and gidA